MSKPSGKALSWLFTASAWVSSVLPGAWGAVITSAGAMLLLLLRDGVRIFADPTFLGAVFLFTMFLWTYIGLAWLITRKPRDVRALRYGVTFEGILPNFTPHNSEFALSFTLQFRNFSPSPLKYSVEEFSVQIETRALPSRYQKNSLQAVLSRGAARASGAIPFRIDHIREFMGKRVDGNLDFSIIYGDADRDYVRRLKMSHHLTLEFPNIPDLAAVPNQGIIPLMFPLGFAANILSESDEPIDS